MRKAALFFNPLSGGRSTRRIAELKSVLALLRGAKIEADLFLPDSTADAAEKVRQAINNGCDTVFACGGDGTIHNVIQVLANTAVALAVLPMGTANALARDLGLPMNVPAAAQAALNGETRRVALGRIQFSDLAGNPGSRFFVVAAGAGADAHLFYKLYTGHKQRIGMAAYYAKAWHLWFSYPMTRFAVDFTGSGSTETRVAEVTELMAVRIRNFGGVLREFAPGASLDRNDVRLILCATASRAAYLEYVARGLLGAARKVRGIELAYSEKVSCKYLPVGRQACAATAKIYVEADGELVGTLPAEINVVPDALSLVAPRCMQE
jgi:diacylglycerol kinase (ATP)